MSSDSSFRVLDRVTAILGLLAQEDGIRISELAQRTGLPKSTVSRLVSGLARQGYVERDAGAVRLGLRLFELGQIADTPQRLRHAALPAISNLSRRTGGAVELAVRDGTEMVCVATARSSAPRASATPTGGRIPVADSAMGQAVTTRATVLRHDPTPSAAASTKAGARSRVVIAMALRDRPSRPDAAISLSGEVEGAGEIGRWVAALEDARQEIARQEAAPPSGMEPASG